MRPVRWLLLDVGGVLEVVDDTAWPSAFRHRRAARLGLAPDELDRRVGAGGLPDAQTRSGVEEAYWSGLGAAVGATADQLAAMRADFWDAYCGTANTGTLAAIRLALGEG